jgi:hypothetical protein
MSTISVSGLSSLYQANSPYAPQVQGPDSTGATDPSSQAATQQAQPHHHHHRDGGGGQFFSKLQSAVTTALQAAQSDGTTDPNQAIQNAIETVLKGQNNSSSSDPANSTTPVTQPVDSTTDSTGDPTTGSTTDASSAVDPQAARAQFFQTLQSYDVDPQQFHQDFVSAIQAARNGQVDPGTAFQSLPPGSLVDETG